MSVVCVAGMHRSGTSLVSRVVNLLGVELGPEEEMIAAGAQNPAGFWENSHIKELNERVLEVLGGRWDAPPRLADGWSTRPELEPLRREASEMLGRLGSEGPRGWKDPRNSLTLPFWHTVTDIDKVIVVLRDPKAVVGSLAERNGFDPEKSAGLWIRYTLDAVRCHQEPLLVGYEALVDQPQRELDRIQAYLGLWADRESGQRAVMNAVKPHLNRARAQEPDGRTLRLASSLYELLSANSVASLLEVLQEVGDASSLRQDLNGVWHAQEELTEERDALARERDALDRDRDRLWARHSNLRADYAARKRAEREQRRRAEDLAEAHRQSQQGLATLQQERDSLLGDLDEAKEQVTELTAQVDRSRRQIQRERQHRQDMEAKYRRLRGRRSVRLAVKVTALARPVFVAVRRFRKRHRDGKGAPRHRSNSDATAQTEQSPKSLVDDPCRGAAAAGHNGSRRLTWVDDVVYPNTITIIVPVYNAVESVQRCVSSLLTYTTRTAELLLLDDGSDDAKLREYLAELNDVSRVRIVRNDTNIGFVKSVNWAFDNSLGDAVVLNSDTEVGPRWLENLMTAAYSDPRVASATALSDNGGAFAAVDATGQPRSASPANLPARARAVAQGSHRVYPETPTANGFCMYVKRDALDSVGHFDAELFPRGYGEENDWSMRAAALGWKHVVDDATLVAHEVAASFGSQRHELIEKGREVIDSRHPSYTELVEEFKRSENMATVRANVARALGTHSERDPAPRVLFVAHEASGGMAHAIVDLVHVLQQFETFALYSDSETLTFGTYRDGEFVVLETCALDAAVSVGETTRFEYREFVAHVMVTYGIELVHIRHLLKHTLDLPDVARRLNLPVVLSLHDYYFVCPTVHLLDEQDRFCGGVCTPTQGRCRTPTQWLHQTPHLKHGWVHVWQGLVDEMLSCVDAVVTTSEYCRDVYARTYERLRSTSFHIIPHGRDLQQAHHLAAPPTEGGTIRILVPGRLGPHKGLSFMRSILDCDAAGRIEFHLLGDVPEEWRGLGVWHGEYDREEFQAWVAKIRPAFVGVFSIWGETYVHTLTEAWAAGIPVVASNMGALAERIEEHGGGWLVEPDDPAGTCDRIIRIADNEGEYAAGLAGAHIEGLPTRIDMARAYERVYWQAMDGRCVFQQR
jgi:GT2 family glycosyltransferase/glycosyltransferase involved in cell wall biosynthesis